jgi:2-polyprenyl-3-methyl-5-hydroxy-6-metoxy-1,4-benzoquinol methylase
MEVVMPTAIHNTYHRACGDEDVSAGRGAGQLDWYRFAAKRVTNNVVLDVGCGLGIGLKLLAETASIANGQDIDPRLAAPNVVIGELKGFEAKSVDVITLIDVIEHLDQPRLLLTQLARIAREGVFLTTPNWTASRCQWPYHVREYTPRELLAELRPFGNVTLYKGTSQGSAVFKVRDLALYCLFNGMRTNPVTSLPARAWNNVIPNSWRIHSHLAAWIALPPAAP